MRCLSPRLFCVAVVAFLLGVPAGERTAQAQSRRSWLTMQDLVKEADVIFVATCSERKTVFQNGSFVTKYRLKPSEYLKGQPRMKLAESGHIEMEELGGKMERPLPLFQYVPGMANIEQDEEVLLFGSYSRFDRKQHGLGRLEPILSPSSIRIVGREQGRFTIVRHPETGEKLVTHKNRSARQAMVLEKQNTVERAPSLQDEESTTNHSQLIRQHAEKQNLSAKIQRTTTMARQRRAAKTEKSPEAGNEVYQFEPLHDVRRRINTLVRDLE